MDLFVTSGVEVDGESDSKEAAVKGDFKTPLVAFALSRFRHEIWCYQTFQYSNNKVGLPTWPSRQNFVCDHTAQADRISKGIRELDLLNIHPANALSRLKRVRTTYCFLGAVYTIYHDHQLNSTGSPCL
jgi:hypothetical protein